jgi:predicted outer membrane lipoprotein
MLPVLLLAAAGTLIPALTMWLADQRARGQN